MQKAIGYIRVSTQGQADEGVSLAAQRAKIEAWCSLNDAELVAVFEDAGISGGSMNGRDGLHAALKATGKGMALVTYSISRLARSTRDMLEIAERLDAKGADLVSMTEKIDTTTAAGRMVFKMLAVLAEALRTVLVKYDNLWRMPFPYVMPLHNAPTEGGDHSGFHFHIEFHPPLRKPDLLKYLAGPEIGGGEGARVDVALLLRAPGVTVFRSHISNALDGIRMTAGGHRVRESLIDGLITRPKDHNDGIQTSPEATDIVVERTRIMNANPQTSCILIRGSGIHIRDSYLAGGGWTLYGGFEGNGHGGPSSTGLEVSGTIFGRDFFKKSGSFGPVTYWGPGNRWSGNTYDNGGEVFSHKN